MFLEAQFGADNVSPIADPRILLPGVDGAVKAEDPDAVVSLSEGADDVKRQEIREQELARLHKLGIPVPGVHVKVDKMEAHVWLEDLEVECTNKVFADRVRAVVDRAVEVTAPLWV